MAIVIVALVSFTLGFKLTHRHNGVPVVPMKERVVPYHPDSTPSHPPFWTFLADAQEGDGGSSKSDEDKEEDEGDGEEDDGEDLPEREGDKLA